MMFVSCDDDIFDDGGDGDLFCSQLLDLLGGLCEQPLEVGGEGAHLVNQENDQESVISKLRQSGQKIVVQPHEKKSELQQNSVFCILLILFLRATS